jgi:hypothetical protein
MAAWASSRKPASPSTTATRASSPSTKAPPASRPTTWSGRKVLRENGATLRELILEMRGVVADLAAVPDLLSLAGRLEEDIAALERALDWILANGKDHLAAVLAGAVPFLHLLGTVCGSWQLARVALAASKPAKAESFGADYLRGLVELARFKRTRPRRAGFILVSGNHRCRRHGGGERVRAGVGEVRSGASNGWRRFPAGAAARRRDVLWWEAATTCC